MGMATDFQDFAEFLNVGKGTVDLLKSAASLLPVGKNRDEIEQKVQAAAALLARNDAKLAKELGYSLCRCTYPPQIMLSKGHHEVHGMEVSVCPKCNSQNPSEYSIRQRDELKMHNERRRTASWLERN